MSYFSEALQQYRTTIVNQDSDPLAALSKARNWLRRYDDCEIVSLNNVHTLTFKSDRSTLVGQPFDDSGSFTLVYKQTEGDWDCTTDNMFRVRMNLDHPKLFFASLLTAAVSEARLKQQILDRVQRFKELYLGDERQFAYRLGVDLGAAARMDMIEQPGANFAVLRAGGQFSPGNASVPDFELWFSRTDTPAHWKFGWIEPPEFHLYKVSTQDIARCQKELEAWQQVVNTFVDPLIDLNWK